MSDAKTTNLIFCHVNMHTILQLYLNKNLHIYIYYSTALGTKDIDDELLEISIKRTIDPQYS
jgi:hypothetical protein